MPFRKQVWWWQQWVSFDANKGDHLGRLNAQESWSGGWWDKRGRELEIGPGFARMEEVIAIEEWPTPQRSSG